MSTESDVVVVGAGYAGLAAAWALQRAGVEATVVEARERVGGRVWTEAAEDGTFIDHGGQWVGPTQDRILALAAEMGVETFPTYGLEGDRHVSIQGRSDLSLEVIGEPLEALERMAADLPADAPWLAAEAAAWDAQTLETWMLANVPDPLGRDLLRAVINAVFTAEPGELSLLHVLAYIRAGGSMMLLTQIDGGAQERRFVGGAQVVAKRLAERLGPDRVRLGAPARRIEQGAGAVEVVADGVALSARRAIVSVPVAVGGQIAYSPPLPGRRAQLHTRMSPGATIKIHCVYASPFWRESGHSGRSFNDDGFASVVFDNTCPDSERGVLVAFAEADAGRRFAALPAAERRQAVLDELAGIFGKRAADPLAYYEQNWLEEEWTRGCFGGNFGPGGWTRYGEALCEPFGLVHWAGAETSPVWMNYIDGAVRSGERAAAEVVAALA